MTRTRFDQFGKQMVRTAVAPRGPVETDAEVPADTRRIDLWFMGAATSVPVPDHLGLLGRITAGPSTLEFFHNTRNGEELAGCLIKHGEFRHVLSLRTPPPAMETWRREAIQEGVKQGIERGIARSLVHIYEARFGAMPEEIRAPADGFLRMLHAQAVTRSSFLRTQPLLRNGILTY